MKKSTKGILAFLFLGGIMATSGVVIAIPGITPEGSPAEMMNMEMTGTPADNYPPLERPRFCGIGEPKSTPYVQEFEVPTECSNPLAIVTDYDGTVWFVQTNTGNVASFDPVTESFSEFENPIWPPEGRSMVWGIDYAPDGSVWFTDENYNSVWKFSILDEKYERFSYPASDNTLPQRLTVDGSQIIINDFAGNKLTLLDPTVDGQDVTYLTVPSPLGDSVEAFSSDFAIDADDNVWYANWIFLQHGVLVKFDREGYYGAVRGSDQQFLPLFDYVETYEMPMDVIAPNGVAVSGDGLVWIADTGSSNVFSFDPESQEFTKYVTAEPVLSTYGNQTGIIMTPISRPYWIVADDQDRLVFNSQNSNNISVLDIAAQSLTEYHIPSKNPYWGDCDPGTGMVADCGLAQAFDLAVDGDKVWFTEWVENNIGVVDTSVPLPVSVDLGSDAVTLEPGGTTHFNFIVSPMAQDDPIGLELITLPADDSITVDLTHNSTRDVQLGSPEAVHIDISAADDAEPGTYKVLLGAQSSDVAVSKFVTVTIE